MLPLRTLTMSRNLSSRLTALVPPSALTGTRKASTSAAVAKLLEKKPDDVVITFAKRAPLGRAKKGQYKDVPVDEMLRAILAVRLSSKFQPSCADEQHVCRRRYSTRASTHLKLTTSVSVRTHHLLMHFILHTRYASRNMPPPFSSLRLARRRTSSRHPTQRAHLHRQPPLLQRPHVHPKHSQRYQSWRRWTRFRSGRGKHDVEVS